MLIGRRGRHTCISKLGDVEGRSRDKEYGWAKRAGWMKVEAGEKEGGGDG